MPKQGVSTYKRKDRRRETWDTKVNDAGGKKKYGTVYNDSHKATKDKQKYCLLIRPYTKMQKAGMTVQELVCQWLVRNRNQVKASTYQKYEGLIRNHINNWLGNIPLKRMTGALLEQYSNTQLLSGSVNGEALSKKTVNDILAILRQAFHFAEEEFHISCPKIRLLREPKKERRVLSQTEQSKLTAYLSMDMDIYKFGVLLALYTGIRIGELCALKWEDISFDTVNICKTMQRLKNQNGEFTEVLINEPKSESSKRKIPLPQFLRPYVMKFRASSGYVLASGNKRFTEPRLMQYKFEKMILECSLNKTNFHALRHTFATRCVESGFDIKSLSEILGHSDVKTTLNRYVHSSFELKQSNMAKLPPPSTAAG